MTRDWDKLSWVPKMDGDVYCSPACGHGCRRRAYEAAVIAAYELSAELGNDWMPEVWEGDGWHWRVTKGLAKLSPIKCSGGYQITFNAHGRQFTAVAPTALQAIRSVQNQCTTAINRMSADLGGIACPK